MTQLEAARPGIVTPEMTFVARREALDSDLVRSGVARGRMAIPANVHHLKKRLEPNHDTAVDPALRYPPYSRQKAVGELVAS